MDTFIVRIYRRIADGHRDAAGTVEHVESGERVPFTDAKELLERLLGAGTRRAERDASTATGAEKPK